jgi:hypothetical protein
MTSVEFNTFSDIPYMNSSDGSEYMNDFAIVRERINDYERIQDNIYNISSNDYDNISRDISSLLIISRANNNKVSERLFENRTQDQTKLKNHETQRVQNEKNNKLIQDVIDGEQDILNKENPHMMERNEIQKRKVEIATYFDKKRKHEIETFKISCLILFGILLICLFFKIGFIEETMFVGVVGFGLAILVIYICFVSIDMILRDEHNYDEYKFFGNKSSSVQENRYDYPLYLQKDIKQVNEMCET